MNITEEFSIIDDDYSIILEVKVLPNSSRNKIVGEFNGALKIAVNAPPEEGKANKAIIDLLSAILDIPKKNIQILSGQTNSHKKIKILGITKDKFISLAFK